MAAKILMIALCAMSLMVIYAFTKSKQPLLTAAKSAGCGVSALLLVNLTSAATGCYIAVNHFTVFISTVLSLPGVVGLVLLNLVFI
ncbi:MAG: pro-sigmaK processing inhibitor BofA family protein [Oscillospiraceae bacterium]|nr:pro-sigmaK processing inhibitor BofA family protein [Oscillospiraceae bacterium]MBQ7815896.1 pro-sigmaK processing inhibitor BofA family protein [Oscillospiraceae bacterium]